MYYKLALIDLLLNGTRYNFNELTIENKRFVLKIFNSFIVNNKGIFCLEKKALKRYFKIVKSFGHLGYDSLFAYTLINDIKIILSDKQKYNFYLEKYISDTLNKYKKENEIVIDKNKRIKQIKNHFKELFSNSKFVYVDTSYLSVFKSRYIVKEGIENSLKYLIKSDEQNICEYYNFIQIFYEDTGINLLGLAHTNIVKLKKV